MRASGIVIALLTLIVPYGAMACSYAELPRGYWQHWQEIELFTPDSDPELIINASDRLLRYSTFPGQSDDSCGTRGGPWVDYDHGSVYWFENDQLVRSRDGVETPVFDLTSGSPGSVHNNLFYYYQQGNYSVVNLSTAEETVLGDIFADRYYTEEVYNGAWIYVYNWAYQLSAYNHITRTYHNYSDTGPQIAFFENEILIGEGTLDLETGTISPSNEGETWGWKAMTATHIFSFGSSPNGTAVNAMNRETNETVTLGYYSAPDASTRLNMAAVGDSVVVAHAHSRYVEVDEETSDEDGILDSIMKKWPTAWTLTILTVLILLVPSIMLIRSQISGFSEDDLQ